jgi:hypothetical protein
MKTLRFALLSLSLLLATGCAQKHQTFKVPQHPLTQDEEDSLQMGAAVANAGQENQWKRQLGLYCPAGGRENVIIHAELGRHAGRVGGGLFERIVRARYMAVATFYNANVVSRVANYNNQPMVSNMCPSGNILLADVLPADAGMIIGAGANSSPTWQTMFWTVSWYSGGRTQQVTSPSVSLWVWNQQRTTPFVWDIRSYSERMTSWIWGLFQPKDS